MKKLVLIFFLITSLTRLAKTQQLPEGIKLPTPEEFAAFEEMIKKATGEKPGGKKTETKVPEKKDEPEPDKVSEPEEIEEIEEPEEPDELEEDLEEEPADLEKLKKAKPTKEQKGPETTKFSEKEVGERGNWRKKKEWLKQTLDKNDLLQEAAANVQKFVLNFYDKFQKTDEILDNFYKEAGLKKGKLEDLFNEVEKYIEKTKAQTKRLFTISLSDVGERIRYEAIKIRKQHSDMYSIDEEFKQKKNDLEQLKVDIKSIEKLDTAAKDRLKFVENKIKEIRSKAEKAQLLSKKIWYVIDDKKAKKIFSQLSIIYQEVKNLQEYTTKDLFADFNMITEKTKKQIETATSSIEKLEKQQIFIRNRAERIEQERKKQVLSLQQKKILELPKRTRRRRSRVPEATFFSTILNLPSTIWNWIKSLFV
jgi:hypothetical protein